MNIRDEDNVDVDSGTPTWSIAKLQAYFNYVRSLKPQLTPESNKILSKYYQRQRQTDQADQARTTVRLLQRWSRIWQRAWGSGSDSVSVSASVSVGVRGSVIVAPEVVQDLTEGLG